MKFEIDDKTGKILLDEVDVTPDGKILSLFTENQKEYYHLAKPFDIRSKEEEPFKIEDYTFVHRQNLEQILQAVKKTQEKLVNKQIQEIQDSKHLLHLKINPSHSEGDVKIIQEFLDDIPVGAEVSVVLNKNIHQIEQNQKIVDVLVRVFKVDRDIDYTTLPQEIKKATGLDIKELS